MIRPGARRPTNGQVDFGGSVDIYYRRASPALTTYFQGGVNDRLVPVSYSEWSTD